MSNARTPPHDAARLAAPKMRIVRSLDEEFARLHARSVALARAVPEAKLYARPGDEGGRADERPFAAPSLSCGEHLLRSAACVEQTFGGVTASLWDDPFEWTLPETLATPALVEGYLTEVEETRRRGFALVRSDEELAREIGVPSGGTGTLAALFFDTLARAAHHQGRAFAVFALVCDTRPPRV